MKLMQWRKSNRAEFEQSTRTMFRLDRNALSTRRFRMPRIDLGTKIPQGCVVFSTGRIRGYRPRRDLLMTPVTTDTIGKAAAVSVGQRISESSSSATAHER